MKDYGWNKIGMIYEAGSNNNYLLSHASNPVAQHVSGNTFRIYYSGRDILNRSSVSYVDYDIEKLNIIKDPKEPILKFGAPDSFYSHGITIGDFWKEGNEFFMGFMGWQHRPDKHWRGDIGKFNMKTMEVKKVLSKNSIDNISLSYPCVLHEDGLYKMWYGSTISWNSDSDDNEMIHTINYAVSKDAKTWDPKGIAIPWKINEAQAFSKPCVLRDKSGYKMWYSFRTGTGSKYEIGFSYSKDGIDWSREQSNLKKSKTGWDSEMICYPHIFTHKEKTYMLYNGNKFGKYGFGIAMAE